MAQGSKAKYTDKQKRQAKKIAEGYQKRGTSKKTAKARAWATVNKTSSGGKKSGSGRGKPENKAPARKGGKKASAGKTTAQRSAAAKKGWETRRRNAGKSSE